MSLSRPIRRKHPCHTRRTPIKEPWRVLPPVAFWRGNFPGRAANLAKKET